MSELAPVPGRPEVPLRVITAADVRASILRAKKSLEDAANEIVWQIEMEAWRTLGYSSWGAMREAEYGGAAFMVPNKNRPELSARMRAKGLTQQEIADTAGVSRPTIASDLASMSNPDVQEAVITNSRGQQRPATYSRHTDDDVIDAEIVEDDGPAIDLANVDMTTGEIHEPETAPDSQDVDLISNLRGPWSQGLTQAARRMTPKARAYVIEALQNTLNKIKEMDQ